MSRQLSLSALASFAAMALFALTHGIDAAAPTAGSHGASPFAIGTVLAQ